MLAAFARLVSGDFKEISRKQQRPQMVTIPFSHYVEFARWSLLYARVQFDEHPFTPGDHILPTLSVRLADKQKAAKGSDGDEKENLTLVPLVVLPEGEVLNDSWTIAQRLSGMGGIDLELKEFLNQQWGPQTRAFAYSFLLKKGNSQTWKDLITSVGGWWLQIKFFLFYDSILRCDGGGRLCAMTERFLSLPSNGAGIISDHSDQTILKL